MPIAATLEFVNVLGLARRDVIIIVAEPVICTVRYDAIGLFVRSPTKDSVQHLIMARILKQTIPPSCRTHAM